MRATRPGPLFSLILGALALTSLFQGCDARRKEDGPKVVVSEVPREADSTAGPASPGQDSATPGAARGPGVDPLGGEFGAQAGMRQDSAMTETREQGLILKDVTAGPPGVMALMDTSPKESKTPEEETRWEWFETLPDFRVRLIPERSESEGRVFTIAGLVFPPEAAEFEAIRTAAREEIRTFATRRILEIRRGGKDGCYHVLAGDRSLARTLVEKGLAWLELESAFGLDDIERREILDAQNRVARAGTGLWSIVRLDRGEWVMAVAQLHRPACRSIPDLAASSPAPAPLDSLSTGASPCRDCAVPHSSTGDEK